MHTAKLDWITPDAEKIIARHARVSTSDPDREEYVRLLSYCIKHGHWSILEQANASFEIITSRAISAQILRHRSFSYQELSQRYCNPFEVVENSHDRPSEFSIRKQAEKNRQSSTDEIDPIFLADFRDRIYRLDAEIYSLYSEMLEAGCARECARNLLPLYTPTKLHMQGTIRSFVHYVGLRAKEDTQLEHQLIARQIAMILGIEMPTVTKAAVDSDDPALEGWKFLRVLN
jgi:thymidylate synthase (FAD)|tara:strand:+ start:701 stop:1393 length:693 start_codon:yes stop_codon:yes gene_type:complete